MNNHAWWQGSAEQSSYGHIIDDILHHSSQLSFRVIDTPTDGRELLEALKDVEDHFIRAYDSGLEVSRMLEVNKVPMLSGLEEIKGWFFFLSIIYLFHLNVIIYYFLWFVHACRSSMCIYMVKLEEIS